MKVNGLMKTARQDTTANEQPVAENRIWIVGANSLQNFLLGAYIEMEIGIRCSYRAEITSAPWEKQCLVMYDCFSVDYSRMWILLESFYTRGNGNVYLSLFNVDPGAKLEKDAVAQGIRGVFYKNETPEILLKGVQAMLSGEIWYSRKITAALLLDKNNRSKVSYMAAAGMTPREKEILLAIAAGSSNSDIAGQLHISTHTVKNHIYNIYRKIKVKSRLEAILWVTKYL